jgi:hypothetical protein
LTESNFEAREIKKSDLGDIQKFYRSLGHHTVIQPTDHVFGVYKSGKLAGVARVTPEFDALVIKGMVFENPDDEVPAVSALVPAIATSLKKKPFYALVDESHLQAWTSMGLKPIGENELNEHLLKRRDFGLKRNSKLTWLVHSAS